MTKLKDVLIECKSYVEALRQGKKGCFLVRNVHDDIDIKRCLHSIHERIPLNMDESIHKLINEHFINVFKWPVRNGVFCFGISNPSTSISALGYGRFYLLFPSSEFEFVCDEEIFDLYEHYRDFFTIYPMGEMSEFLGSINYSNSNLQYAMSRISSFDRSSEIIINCQYYYLVNFKYIDKLVDLIWGSQPNHY